MDYKTNSHNRIKSQAKNKLKGNLDTKSKENNNADD